MSRMSLESGCIWNKFRWKFDRNSTIILFRLNLVQNFWIFFFDLWKILNRSFVPWIRLYLKQLLIRFWSKFYNNFFATNFRWKNFEFFFQFVENSKNVIPNFGFSICVWILSVTTILNQTSSKKSPNSNKLDSKSDSDPFNKTSDMADFRLFP